MKIKVGSKVETEFGIGIVTAITKEWCIVYCSEGEGYEIGLYLPRQPFIALLAEGFEIGGGQDGEINT